MDKKEQLILLLNYLFFDRQKLIRPVLGVFASIEEFRQGYKAFFAKANISMGAKEGYQKKIDVFKIDNYLCRLEKQKIQYLFSHSPAYPEKLRQLADFPEVVFYKGDITLLKTKIFGVVGSRQATNYGIKVTEHLVEGVVPYFNVCSGLARGIDAVVHKTALKSKNPTIAVVATGLDIIYPTSNTDLFYEIEKNGLILTENPPGTEPFGYRFPQRNRIIAALSKGVLVTEAAERSGSLITAHLAAELGRDVFAVPGSIFSYLSKGPHKLIQEGAKLVNKADDIINEYKDFQNLLFQFKEQKQTIKREFEIPDSEKIITKALEIQPLDLDELVLKTKKTVPFLLEKLTLLELKDIVVKNTDCKYELML
ncbi:DNA-processing protein DprA [Candidatus Margulisiibacteriota bacterium]